MKMALRTHRQKSMRPEWFVQKRGGTGGGSPTRPGRKGAHGAPAGWESSWALAGLGPWGSFAGCTEANQAQTRTEGPRSGVHDIQEEDPERLLLMEHAFVRE